MVGLMPNYIFADLNVRDDFVSPSKETLLYDTKVVVQSIWRLLTTEEGEIPNFRNYGLSIKKYCQYPMNKDTINEIYKYVRTRVETFEPRGEIISSELSADISNGVIGMRFLVRVKSTGDVVKLPTWTVQLGAAA